MRNKTFGIDVLPMWIGSLFFAFFSIAFWMKVTQHGWTCIGDTLDAIVLNAFQVSGFFRGEYYLWDPLIRCGQNETTAQMLFFANPVSNLINGLSVLAHSHDMVVVYATIVYVMIVLYSVGMALLTTTFTNNSNAGIFVFIVTLSSSTVLVSGEEFAFIFILYAVPWMIYGMFKYFSKFQFHFFCSFLWHSVFLFIPMK